MIIPPTGELAAGSYRLAVKPSSIGSTQRCRLGAPVGPDEDFPQKILRLAQPTSDPWPSAFRATWYWRPLRGELAGDP